MSAAVATPPKVIGRDEWLSARKDLLEKEKELTRANDALSAQRRKLGMVKVDKDYVFTSSDDKKRSLADLFDGKPQLIVYHFMFAPDWERGCNGCQALSDSFPDTRHLRFKDTSFVSISRAAPEKLQKHKTLADWKFPWYSSQDTDFNYDFNATVDDKVHPDGQVNFRTKEETEKLGKEWYNGDVPGFSTFYKDGDNIYHTYSTWARGGEKLLTTYQLLDMTPLGRDAGANGPAEFKLGSEYGDQINI